MPEPEQGHDAEIKTRSVGAKREAVVVIRPPAHLGTLHSPALPDEIGRETILPGQNSPAANVAAGGHYQAPEANQENGEYDPKVLVYPGLHLSGIVSGMNDECEFGGRPSISNTLSEVPKRVQGW